MSFAYSNVVAAIAVLCLPIVGGKWIAPKLTIPGKRCFYALSLWGIPYFVGQCAQQDEWGSLWMQYHLLDLCYAPWGTALAMCAFGLALNLIRKQASTAALFALSLGAILAFGYISEIWDTAWALAKGSPLHLAVDTDDYAAITYGAIIAAVYYMAFQATALRRVKG